MYNIYLKFTLNLIKTYFLSNIIHLFFMYNIYNNIYKKNPSDKTSNLI